MAPKSKQIARRAEGKVKECEKKLSHNDTTNRLRSSERYLFNRVEREVPRFNALKCFDDMPPHVQFEIMPLALENFSGGLSPQRAMEEAIYTVLAQHEYILDTMLQARGYVGSYLDEDNVYQPIFTNPIEGAGRGAFGGR